MQVTHRRRARQQVKVEDATQDALAADVHSNGNSNQDASNNSSLTDALAMPAIPKAPKRKRTAKVKAEPQATAEDALAPLAEVIKEEADADQTAVTAPKKQKRQTKGKDQVNPVEAVAAAVDAVASDEPGKKKPKRQRVKATELAVDTETELLEDAPVKSAVNLLPS